jgi:hypothetical protein
MTSTLQRDIESYNCYKPRDDIINAHVTKRRVVNQLLNIKSNSINQIVSSILPLKLNRVWK